MVNCPNEDILEADRAKHGVEEGGKARGGATKKSNFAAFVCQGRLHYKHRMNGVAGTRTKDIVEAANLKNQRLQLKKFRRIKVLHMTRLNQTKSKAIGPYLDGCKLCNICEEKGDDVLASMQ